MTPTRIRMNNHAQASSRCGLMRGLLAGTALAGALVIMLPGAVGAAPAPETVLQAQSAEARAYDIPAGSLAAALNRFADESGLQLVYDAVLTTGLQAKGIQGTYTSEQALRLLLAGTGIAFEFKSDRTVVLERPDASGQRITLGTVSVEGRAVSGLAEIGNLPPAYAGGQVAAGSKLGLLGNKGVMDTPFNQTSYTGKLIQDQQARKLDDVLVNDPSVSPNAPRAYGFDFVAIRGFNVPSTAYGINGLYGIASNFSFMSLGAVERVEVLKGPGSLLNGMPPGGGVGGSVNLVTKRATDAPITNLTTSFISESQLGAHFDVGRRFGEKNEFGLRVNGAYRNGDTELDHQRQELGSGTLAFDYRGERVRLSVDAGYEKNNTDAMTRYVTFGNLASVPDAPDAESSFMPDWGYWDGEGKMGLVQGEVDVTNNLTAYAQAGIVSGDTTYLYSDAKLSNLNGDFNGSPRLNSQEREQSAMQAGFRLSQDTGFINHAINFNIAASSSVTKIINTTGTAFVSNIYNPVASATPGVAVGDPVKRASSDLSSFGIADTMSVLDERIQVTVGVRQQYVDTASFNTSGQETSSYDTDALTPGFAIVGKPTQNISVYANYVEGLETGSVVGSTYANAGEILPALKTTQKEAGIKVDWGRLTTTVSAFEITKPLQIVGTGNILTQDGESRHRGIEANLFGELREGLRILGGAMYVDARQEKTENGQYDGKRVFGVSDLQLRLGAEWDTPFVTGLTLSGRIIHNSGFYANASNTQEAPSWTRFDIGARYALKTRWSENPININFGVENLFGANYWQGANTDSYVFLGAPRTFLLSMAFNL
ncbi:MAG: TonB-dependent receptor [Rhodospirillales bacterium]